MNIHCNFTFWCMFIVHIYTSIYTCLAIYIYMYTHTRYILIISLVISHLCRRQRTCRRQGDHGFFIDSNGNGLAMDWVAVFFPLDVKDGNLSFSPIYILYTCIYTVYVYIYNMYIYWDWWIWKIQATIDFGIFSSYTVTFWGSQFWPVPVWGLV